MRRPSVIEIGVAIHTVVEQALKKGVPVKHASKRTAAQDEALRLRNETAARERKDFGKKTAAALTDESSLYMAEEVATDRHVHDGVLNPTVTEQLGQMGSSLSGLSIMEEIQSDRSSGRLRPFVEGEPIGVIQNHVRGPAPALMTPAQIKEEERTALRGRQQRNDHTLAKLARRYR